ncbi:MAG: hypothetical protein V3S64_03800 [bacterium]
MEKLIEALDRGDFDSVLRDMLATAEKEELEQLVMSLTAKAGKMEPSEERNQYLRGIQSIRAALKIRFFKI